MKCNYCGAQIPDGRKFCTYCGTLQEQKEQTEQVKNPEWVDDLKEKEPDWDVPFVMPVPVRERPAAEPWQSDVKQPDANAAPRLLLPTGRGLGKMFFLGILTLGIYPIVIWSRIVTELDIAASRYDGKKTTHFCLMAFLFSWLTFGISPIVWYHKISDRIGNELRRRGIMYDFGAGTFWGWNILGALIGVGPLVYMYKLFKAMNLLCSHYNVNG
jgi:hypothetical protein